MSGVEAKQRKHKNSEYRALPTLLCNRCNKSSKIGFIQLHFISQHAAIFMLNNVVPTTLLRPISRIHHYKHLILARKSGFSIFRGSLSICIIALLSVFIFSGLFDGFFCGAFNVTM